MARIRSIKPEFWTDGDIVELSPYARLLFIGTWNFALCDLGHLPDDPTRLKLQILPCDDVDVRALLDELLEHGRIDRIQGPDGRSYLHVRRFTDHQRSEKRWNSRCPVCAHTTSPNHTESRATLRKVAQTRPTSAQDRTGQDSKNPPTPQRGKRGSRRAYDYDQDPEFLRFWSAYPQKRGKPAAFKAWQQALKRGADPELIITAAERYRDEPSRNPDKTKYPQGWLSDERYNDQQAPSGSSNAEEWWNN